MSFVLHFITGGVSLDSGWKDGSISRASCSDRDVIRDMKENATDEGTED